MTTAESIVMTVFHGLHHYKKNLCDKCTKQVVRVESIPAVDWSFKTLSNKKCFVCLWTNICVHCIVRPHHTPPFLLTLSLMELNYHR